MINFTKIAGLWHDVEIYKTQLCRRKNPNGTTVGIWRWTREVHERDNVKLDDTVLHMRECWKAYTLCLGSEGLKMQAVNHSIAQDT
jgi:hypothetical protein